MSVCYTAIQILCSDIMYYLAICLIYCTASTASLMLNSCFTPAYVCVSVCVRMCCVCVCVYVCVCVCVFPDKVQPLLKVVSGC